MSITKPLNAYLNDVLSHSKATTDTKVDKPKSNNSILRVCDIESRKSSRIFLFSIFVRLKDTSKLILIEKTIPNTVNSVCNTTTLPFTPAIASSTAIPIANAMRIIILLIFLLAYLA